MSDCCAAEPVLVCADAWKSRWLESKHKSDYGLFVLTAGKFYGDAEKDKGEWGKDLCPPTLFLDPLFVHTLFIGRIETPQGLRGQLGCGTILRRDLSLFKKKLHSVIKVKIYSTYQSLA